VRTFNYSVAIQYEGRSTVRYVSQYRRIPERSRARSDILSYFIFPFYPQHFRASRRITKLPRSPRPRAWTP